VSSGERLSRCRTSIASGIGFSSTVSSVWVVTNPQIWVKIESWRTLLVNSFAMITLPEFRAVPFVREIQNFAVWGAIWSAGVP